MNSETNTKIDDYSSNKNVNEIKKNTNINRENEVYLSQINLTTTNNLQNKKNLKNSNEKNIKKIILRIIISIILSLLLALILVFLLKKNKTKSKEKEQLEPIKTEIQKPLIPKPYKPHPNFFSYKISTLYFNSTKIETTNMKFEDKKIKLEEKKKTINTEYLFTIVSEPNESNNYYIGYFLILSRNETIEGNEKIKYFDDSDNINNDKNFKVVMRVNFKDDGTLVEQNIPKDINNLYFNELNDTIACFIPIYLNKREIKLDDFEGQNNPKKGVNKNDKWISNDIRGRLILDDIALINSEYKAIINVTIEEGNCKQCIFNKNISIRNGEYGKSNDNLNLSGDTYTNGYELNDDFTIKGFIDSIETISTQTVKFKEDGGEELAKKYKDKLEKLQWLIHLH